MFAFLPSEYSGGIFVYQKYQIIIDSSDEDQAYIEYVIEKIPYRIFIEIYQIDSDSFVVDSYEDFINDLIIDTDYDSSPFEIDFVSFIDLLENYGGETTLNEQTYSKAAMQIKDMEILSSFDFREKNDSTVRETFIYNPAISINK